MKKSNKQTEESDKEIDTDSEKDLEEKEEEDIQPPVKKKTGKGNFVMTEARLTQLALAREKASQLRKQINESKTVPLKKEKKPSKLEIKLEKLKMDTLSANTFDQKEEDIEEKKEIEKEKEPIEEEPIVDLHKTIRPKPKQNQIQPVEIVEPIVSKPVEIVIEPVLKKEPSIRKIGKFYYI